VIDPTEVLVQGPPVHGKPARRRINEYPQSSSKPLAPVDDCDPNQVPRAIE
jgi:hypothetical protein